VADESPGIKLKPVWEAPIFPPAGFGTIEHALGLEGAARFWKPGATSMNFDL
jgi:hypothetical protein